MGAVPQRVLKSPIASLVDSQAEITAALDFLFHGY
jgi:toxin CcdB